LKKPPLILLESIRKLDGVASLIFIFTQKSDGCVVIMDLTCFKQIDINDIRGQFTHLKLPIWVEAPVKFFGKLIVIVV
jgi:hypothetical protein